MTAATPEPRNWECKFCPLTFDRLSAAEEHVREKHPQPPVTAATPGQASLSPAFARWYRIGLPLAADDVLAAAWTYQHEAERAFWAEVDAAQETQPAFRHDGKAAYEVWRAAVPDVVCNVPGGAWEDLPVTVQAGFNAIAAQDAPEPSRTEWVVFWGGESPDDCAGWDSRDDEADAEEHREWITGGGVAQRPVMYGPWTVTVPPPPADRGLSGDWSDEELAEFRRWREQKQETGQ